MVIVVSQWSGELTDCSSCACSDCSSHTVLACQRAIITDAVSLIRQMPLLAVLSYCNSLFYLYRLYYLCSVSYCTTSVCPPLSDCYSSIRKLGPSHKRLKIEVVRYIYATSDL